MPQSHDPPVYTRNHDGKLYELKDHLGNVRVVIRDWKVNGATSIRSFIPKIVSYSGYYPFGMQMHEDTWESPLYRYGYNGKEKDGEIKGEGNSYDYGARLYDPRVGRWLSTDPLSSKYPAVSPFAFSLNTPIGAMDPDGKVVLFINGQFPFTGGGNRSYWKDHKFLQTGRELFAQNGTVVKEMKWKLVEFDVKAMNAIGDHHPRYYDGSVGGFENTLFEQWERNNTTPEVRWKSGYAKGVIDAFDIFSKLQNGETIKIVAHSMGNVYGYGMAAGLLSQVAKWNESHPEKKLDPKTLIEAFYAYSPYNGDYLEGRISPDNIDKQRFFIGGEDDLATMWYRIFSLGNQVCAIPGSTPRVTPTTKKATHNITDFEPSEDMDKSTHNGSPIPSEPVEECP